MKYSNTVEYNISTKLDSSGLQKLKTELQQVELKLQKMGNQKLLNPDDFSNARTQIRGLSDALSKAFDPTLGITNLSKLNEELKSSGVTTEGLRSAFSQLGTDGQIAFNNVIGELGKLDTGILRTNSQIDKLFTTFSNTFRWGLVSSFFSQFMNAIHSSVDYVKELDDSLTQIMLVTDYNKDSMNEFARSANEAAKAVSMTTTGMTNASLIFAQQGYDLNQSQELATLSAKVANASQQDTATTSDQITAYMNAYGLENSIGELTQAMDNWALIANISAADVSELAQASQRAASMANTVGVSGEQLAAQIATIESVTREAPEQIGNGLKTLYARFSDISQGGEDEDGIKLGDVTAQLNAIGVQILDQFGNIRDVGDIMEDLMYIWDDLDQTSKIAAAQSLAGKYQVNRFVSLMDNSDMYREYLGATGSSATGTLDQMNEEYAQSIEGRSAKLQASLEGLFSTVFNTDDIYPWIDAAQGAIDLLQQFFDALGGGKTVLLGISSLLMQVFSKNMAQEINNATINNAVQEQRRANLENKQAALSNMGMANPELDNGMSNYIIDFAKQINGLDLNKEQAEQANNILMELIQNANAAGQASDELATKISGIGTALVSTLGEDSKILTPILEDGIINDTLLRDFLDNASDDQLKELFEGSRQAIAQTKIELKEFSQALQTFQQETKENDQSADELKNSIERLRDAFSYIKNTIDTSTYNQYDEELRNIIETLENSDDASDDVSVLTNRIAKLYEELDKIKGVNVEKIQQISSDLERSNFKQINTQGAFEGTKQVGNAFLNSANKTGDIKNIIDTVNAIQQLTFAWQTFQNLGSIWKNNKLSDGEKFLQTFMSLTSAILMMQPAIEVLSKKFGVLNLQQAANVLTSAKLTIAKHAETIAFGASSVAAGDLAAKQWLLVASEEAATIAATALKTALTLLASPAGIIGIMGIATAIGFVQAQAEEAKQQALDNLEDAKSALQEIETLKDKIGTFKEGYNTYKESGEGGDELIQQANEIAQAMKEAGAEEEANTIHLAALKAEAQGTADNFNALANAIENSQDSISKNANNEAIAAAEKLLKTENVSAEDVLRHQSMLKEAQEELNNLDPLDAGYEAEKERLEHLIATLKDAKLAEEGLVDAANIEMNSKLDIGAQKVAETEGQNMHVFQAQDAATARAGTEALTPGAMNWVSIDQYFKEISPEYAAITDEAERAAIAYQHMGTEAGKAAVEVGQLLLANENLTDNGGIQTTYDANTGQALSQYELIGRQGIQSEMSDAGLTHEQQVEFLATLDENASESEIRTKLAELKQKMQDDQDFDVALKASLDPEQLDEMVKNQINSYEPTDEDVDADQFKSMANYIHDADESAFEEGGALEDISPEIQNNADALEELVEGILRYDDAISTLSEKEEDWRDALSDSADLADRTEAIGELKETYSDFLDLSDDVSNSFAENTDNLDLMAEAAAGDVDAYNELLAAASEDIAVKIYGIDESSAALQSMSDYLQSDAFKDVEVGMAINDQAFYDALNQMIVEGNWTQDQLESYLNNIGTSLDPTGIEQGLTEAQQQSASSGAAIAENSTFTTTVETGTAQSTDTEEATSYDVTAKDNGTWEASLPTATVQTAGMPSAQAVTVGGSLPPDIEVTATPVKTINTKEASASSVKTEQGGAGDFHVKNGGVRKNNSGGAKSNHASPPPSSPSKGSCFVAGTLITTFTGFSPIEQIKQGDIVLSYNESLHQLEYSPVVQTMIHDVVEPIYTLHIKDEQLRVTGIHRFLVSKDIFHSASQWIPAADLQIGDWMFLADGTWHLIHNIEVNVEHQIVYNFEVAGNHNYYVGRNQILAHNKGGSCFVAGTLISTSLGFKPIEQIQKGDIVLSYNKQIELNEYSEVLQTMIHDTTEPIYTLYIKNEQLRVTGIHRFFVVDKITCGVPQWVHAADLHVGQWVLFADGTWHVIHKIEVNIEYKTVYNFEVSHNHNYYVGRNQILAHNKGGKGKKGGSGKKKEIKKKEKREHEKDYYEEVNSQLDKTEKLISKIEKEEDRLIGDKARANQNKQLKLLQKEIDLNKEKLKIQKQELKDVDALIKKEDERAEKAALSAGVHANIPGIILDEDGVVSNYEEISKTIDKTYNDLVKKYNEAAKKGDEKLAEKVAKNMDKFDDYSKNLLDQIKRHNKLQGEIVETEGTLESLADAMEDIRIDAYKASQEAIDNLKEIRESAAELDKFFRNFDDSSFMNKFSIDDTPYGDLIEDLSKLDNIYSVTKEDANAFYQDLINQKEKALKKTKDEDEKQAIQKSIDFFTEQQANLKDGASLDNGLLGLAQQDLARLQGWIDNPKAKDNIYGDNEAALFEAYQEAYERTLGLFKDYRELVQSTRDDILDIYSDAEEAIERQIDQFDRLSEKMERISDTYTLYYGEDSYDQLNQFYAQQGNIMQNQLNQLTAAYDLWKTRYEQAVKTGDEEIIKKTKDLMDEAEDAMLDAAQELAELWVEKFENAVEASSQHIYNNLFGSNDIDELTDNWELQKDYMDRYKDDVEKAYEIDKLRSKYLDLLDEAQGSSVQTQNRIRQQMQEQLDLLENQATVSEYDVKLANAKLEILQKQMALEDAQRNKNKMQLRRDTQGNYRYIYTADQGNVKEAQQDLEDSQYDAYEMTKEETVANNDRAINLLQDYIEKRAAIWNKYKDDATARGQALAELEAEYGKIFDALAEDFTNTSEGMYDILNWLVKNGSEDTTTAAINMLDTLYDKNGEVKDKTGQDWMDMASLIADQVLPNIENAVTKANLEMENQAIELKDSMTGPNGALTKIGSGADDVADSMDKAAESTRDLATATSQLFTSLGADDAELDKALKKLAEYEAQLRQTQQTTSNLSTQLKTANKTIAAKNAEALNYKTIFDYKSGAKKFKKGDTVTLKKGTWVSYHRDGDQYDESGNNGFTLSKDTQVKIIDPEEHHTRSQYGSKDELAKYSIGIYEAGKEVTKETGTGMSNKSDSKKTERWHISPSALRQALAYDTGGYTGEWNDSTSLHKNGKLAVLHQKELVLNSTDSENILNAVSIMREITAAIKNSNAYVSAFKPGTFMDNNKEIIKQRVEISATFPNVSSITDIEQALMNLSDQAYIYANKTI